QPHLYSRTRDFATEFGVALSLADVALLLDVYAAREEPLPGVTGALLAQAVPLPASRVHYEPCWAVVPARLAGLVRRAPARWPRDRREVCRSWCIGRPTPTSAGRPAALGAHRGTRHHQPQ